MIWGGQNIYESQMNVQALAGWWKITAPRGLGWTRCQWGHVPILVQMIPLITYKLRMKSIIVSNPSILLQPLCIQCHGSRS
jgi:hypothetical protein